MEHGCLNIPERMFNVFVFLPGENVAIKEDGTSIALKQNTFINGANLEVYPVERIDLQERMAQTTIEKIGTLDEAVFTELVACLSESKMVKNKYRRILKS